jgi:hypothetical protein
MPWGFAIAAAGTVASGAMGASASKSAARTQAASAEADRRLQQEQYYDQVNRQEPFRQAGLQSVAELQRQFGLAGDSASAGYGNLLRDFSTADFQADPGYAFRLSEGLKGMDRQAAARGGLISGAALKAAGRYGQDMASQEYQNAYNRYNQNRSQRYQMLTGQQTAGANATNAQNQSSANYASAAGNALQNAGNARASGYMGQANAWGGALNSAANAGLQYGFNQMSNPYASPAQGAAIQAGWNAWKDPMLAGGP